MTKIILENNRPCYSQSNKPKKKYDFYPAGSLTQNYFHISVYFMSKHYETYTQVSKLNSRIIGLNEIPRYNVLYLDSTYLRDSLS